MEVNKLQFTLDQVIKENQARLHTPTENTEHHQTIEAAIGRRETETLKASNLN
jgi:hypothetical protein